MPQSKSLAAPARAGAVLLAVFALLLAACSATGGRQAESGGDLRQQVDLNVTVPEEPMTISMITHAAPGDTFWDLVRKGAEDGTAVAGVDLEYTSDPEGSNQANLVRQAVDKNVDGIVVSLAKPAAMRAAVTDAVDAGIPVVAINSGSEHWAGMGVQSFFGQDERVAGEAAGERLADEGRSKVLCVIHEQGNVGHEARCAGAAATGPQTEKLYVTGTDVPSVRASITSKLQQDPEIDAVLMLTAPLAVVAVDAAEQAGSDAVITTFDTNAEAIEAIKAGDIEWAVDQQPYLQGYLSVQALWLNRVNGNEVGGGQQVLTGPSFVDADNVDEVAQYAKNGTR